LAVLAWALYPALRVQYQTSRRVAGLEQQYSALRKRNETLRATVAELRTPQGVEKAARESLGFTKKGENVYVVMPASGTVAATAAAASAVGAPGATGADDRTAVQVILDAVFGVAPPASAADAP
jgi:hypothetical protein